MSINGRNKEVGTFLKFVFVSFLSVAVVAVVFSTTTAKAQETSVEDLENLIKNLTQQIQDLQSDVGTTTSGVRVSSSSSSCTSWDRNLTQGSTGEDVRRLQQFLNSDSDTQVAVTGAGSPGNETSFYGPATARAVTKFQEKYAANILTPLGLTSGTGGFYRSTRTYANSICTTGSGSTTSTTTTSVPQGVSVSGAISVQAGNQPLNGIAVKGALRVPFTVFTVTGPADGRATIDRITVRMSGLAGRSNIDKVVLLDEDGLQVGNGRSINSDLEAVITPRVQLRSGETRQFTVAANIAGEDDVESGEIARLSVVEIEASTDVTGLPVSGAAHTFNSSIDLPSLSVRDRNDDGGDDRTSATSVEFDEEDIVFFSVELEADGGENNDDVLLESITLEQVGSANDEDIDVEFVIDDESQTVRGRNGIYSVVFRTPIRIEDGDSIDLEVVGTVLGGDGRDVQFELDEDDDIFARDARYRYGISTTGSGNIDFDNNPGHPGGWFIIESGSGTGGVRRGSLDDVLVGQDDALLGVFEVEVEGENLEFGDIRFNVELSPTQTDADELDTRGGDSDHDEPELSRLRLVLDGRTLARSDRIEFRIPDRGNSANEDFDVDDIFEGNFELEDGTHDIEIYGSLNDEFEEGDDITFDITRFDDVRGVETGDRVDVSNPGELRSVSVKDDDFEVTMIRLSDTNAVEGADSVVFARIRLNAEDSSGDVLVRNIDLQFYLPAGVDAAVGRRIGDTIENCEIQENVEDGDTLTTSRSRLDEGSLSSHEYDFRGRGLTVEAGERMDVALVCQIANSGVTSGDKYGVQFPANGEVEYEVGDREDTIVFASDTPSTREVMISDTGTLELTRLTLSNSNETISVGNSGEKVQIGRMTFDAENDDVEIKDIVFVATTDIPRSVRELILEWNGGSDSAREDLSDRNFDTNDSDTLPVRFDDVNITVTERGTTNVNVFVQTEGIGDDPVGTPNQKIAFSLGANMITATSVNADDLATSAITGDESARPLGTIYIQRSNPGFNFNHNLPSGSLSEGKEKLYRFSIAVPSDGDVSLRQLTFNIDLKGNATAENVELHAYTGSNFSGAADTSYSAGTGGQVGPTVTSFTDETDFAYVFGAPGDPAMILEAGKTYYFELIANVTDVPADSSITTRLIPDATASDGSAGAFSTALTSAKIIWSPNSEEQSSELGASGDSDWFDGDGLITSSVDDQTVSEND